MPDVIEPRHMEDRHNLDRGPVRQVSEQRVHAATEVRLKLRVRWQVSADIICPQQDGGIGDILPRRA